MRKILTILFFIILLLILGFFFVDIYAERIQEQIKSDTQKNLRNSGYTTINVTVDGRNVKLSGEAKDKAELKKIESLATQTLGVSSVNNAVKIKEAVKAEIKQPEIKAPEIEEVVHVDVVNVKKLEPTEEMKQAELPKVNYVPAELPEAIEAKPEPKKEEELKLAENLPEPAPEVEKKPEIITPKTEAEKLPEKIVKEIGETKIVAQKPEEIKPQAEPVAEVKEEKQPEKQPEEPKQVEVATTKQPEEQKAGEPSPTQSEDKKLTVSVRLKPTELDIVEVPQTSDKKGNCDDKIDSIVNRSPIIFRPGTQYIEFKTGNTLTEIANILKSCSARKLIVTGYGFDNLAKERADTIALLLRDIEQIPQSVSTKVIAEAAVGSPVTFNVVDR